MEKLSAVVILYNPKPETIEYIRSYLPYVDKLYAIDNSEVKSAISDQIAGFDKIVYLDNNENYGIAKPLNQACKLAIEDGFNWLLTMDQDSSFSQNNILAYINCWEGLGGKEQIAMTGVEFIKKENGEVNCTYTEVTSLITSGSMINLALFTEIGPFDEALFIDQVDLEYCYRAILKGYKIIKLNNIFFTHSLGVSSLHKSLKNLKNTSRSLHSPLRIYYITRNYFYIKSKYKKNFSREIYESKKDLFIRLKNNLLYGKQKVMVINYFLKGIIDFKRKKMGKI